MKQSLPPDAELIRAIQSGPRERDAAIALLWDDTALRNMAIGAVLKMGHDADTALDCFGESLVQFMLAVLRGKFRGESTIRTYIVAICINLGKRRYIRPPKYTGKESSVSNENLPPNLPDPDADALETLIDTETDDRIQSLLKRLYSQLPGYCEQTLRWHYAENRSAREIAGAEQVEEQSIKNRLQKCRDKLRALIHADPEAMNIIRERIKLWIDKKK